MAAIFEADVELVSVSRPASNHLAGLAEALSANRQGVQARWEQSLPDTDAATRALASQIDEQWLPALNEEVLGLTDVLTALLGCERIGFRLATLRAPMCPRFHVDQIPCRMLTTISGPGTEWIANDDVDPVLFADRQSDALPVRAGKNFNQLPAGSWSLLKGSAWDRHYSGFVHRSPHVSGERLLLSMDPIFN
jgi:hypothetical protein